MHLCIVRSSKKFISLLLILLVLTTNMVLSIDSVFCHCFKTTTLQISGFEDICCDSHFESTCNIDKCCQKSFKKPACKTKTNILIFNNENIFSDQSNKTLKTQNFEFSIPTKYHFELSANSDNSYLPFCTNISPPTFKHSRSFLQIFTC